MKNTKLTIDNFLSYKLENQIMIFGGDEIPLEGGVNPRGTSTSSGNGSGDTPPYDPFNVFGPITDLDELTLLP